MTEHETNLRDLAAMFAMAGLLARGEVVLIPRKAFAMADEFMQERNPTPEDGIAAIKPTKRKEPK